MLQGNKVTGLVDYRGRFVDLLLNMVKPQCRFQEPKVVWERALVQLSLRPIVAFAARVSTPREPRLRSIGTSWQATISPKAAVPLL